jgi:outer membrane protein OmpA-like peptidoglycan-associated protein
MAKCRPTKWLPWALLGAGLPLLAAYMVSTKSLHEDIATRASGALSANEATAWAKVDSNARDLTVSGTAPSQQALDDAVKAVAGTYGVRTVANTVQIVEPVKLVAPTVDSVNVTTATPEIKGTWQEGVATALAVTVAGATYKLGEAPELTTLAGNWLLKLTKPLAEGNYDVTVESSDGTQAMAAAAPGKLVVDLPDPEPAPVVAAPLAAPTVMPYFGNSATPTFTGTWPEADAKTADANLEVKVGDTAYVIGKNPELTSDGAGNWQLQVPMPLLEGELNVMASVVDKAGAPLVMAAAPAKAIVDLTPPAAPVIAVPVAGAIWPYPISGTWSEEKGSTLTAKIQDRTYTLNGGAALTSDGKGNFTFAPVAKLPPGSYDVDFTVNDAAGNSVMTTAKAAIVIAEPAPPPPPPPVIVPATPAVVDAVAADAKWPYPITGMWDEKPGHTLSASVSGRTYVLGRGAALTSDGAGKFSFAPAAKFAPGKYDVVFTTNDETSESKITVAQAAIIVPEPMAPVEPAPAPAPKMELPVPTVTSQLDLTGAPIIKGTWPQDKAKSLTVTVDGRAYVLGKDANLGAKDGTWSLFPGAALKDGTYDVQVSSAAEDGTTAVDATNNELEVDGTPPAAPTVMTMAGDKSPDHLSGTWDEAGATGLKVMVPQTNVVAELGAANSPLTSDGAGKWRLNLAAPLPVGTYNVIAQTMDNRGRMQEDVSEGEVVVAAAGTPVPQPVAFDCVAVMNRIANVFPIRFEYDLTDITRPFETSVGQYAALLKDSRCTSINVEVEGHADFRGSDDYNMALSERRANVIVGMLKDAGVDMARMSVKGFGESAPLDPAETDEARTKNRRVQIMVKQ